MDLLKTFGPLIGSVAPTLATALGGPLAGVAVKALSEVLLGHPDGNDSDIATALSTATPEQLASVKKVDADFKVQMRSLDIDLERIAVDDRKSARDMQKETKDWLPRVLAIGVTFGFFWDTAVHSGLRSARKRRRRAFDDVWYVKRGLDRNHGVLLWLLRR